MKHRLIPKPHTLRSKRNKKWSLSGAIHELIDNSLGHGKASNVTVIVDNTVGIEVIDDGIGVDDINRVFCFGDASATDDLAEIGQYGVGGTDAAVYLGDVTTVETVYNGRHHDMTINWKQVERSGQWPLAYEGAGRLAKANERGTKIHISKLARKHYPQESERMARDFGHIFAPALRRGVTLSLKHRVQKYGELQVITATPFNPPDLKEETFISGEIATKDGVLKWSGRAGLSASLIERFNAVHIAFGHRVIETTRDPFKGKSAPTLYVEIKLNDTTPWKYFLSEYKDEVVDYRDELVDGIHNAVKTLLEKSERQAQNLALNAMISPIETALNTALKGAGLLHFDPNEEPNEGGQHGDGEGGKRGKRKHTPKDKGEPAKEAKQPTGVRFDWRTPLQLQGRAFSWEISGPTMTILLDQDIFKPVIEWPPKARDLHVAHMIVGFVAHSVEMEYWNDEKSLRGVITAKLISRLEDWSNSPSKIAPYLYRELITGARIPAPADVP